MPSRRRCILFASVVQIMKSAASGADTVDAASPAMKKPPRDEARQHAITASVCCAAISGLSELAAKSNSARNVAGLQACFLCFLKSAVHSSQCSALSSWIINPASLLGVLYELRLRRAVAPLYFAGPLLSSL